MNSCGATRSCKVREVALRNDECCEESHRPNMLCRLMHQQEEVLCIHAIISDGLASQKLQVRSLITYTSSTLDVYISWKNMRAGRKERRKEIRSHAREHAVYMLPL